MPNEILIKGMKIAQNDTALYRAHSSNGQNKNYRDYRLLNYSQLTYAAIRSSIIIVAVGRGPAT